MIDTPVSTSPAMIARSIGAAPRQRGRREGWTLKISRADSSGSLMSAPKAQTTAIPARAPWIRASASGVLIEVGWHTSSPSSRALNTTGGALSLRPRP